MSRPPNTTEPGSGHAFARCGGDLSGTDCEWGERDGADRHPTAALPGPSGYGMVVAQDRPRPAAEPADHRAAYPWHQEGSSSMPIPPRPPGYAITARPPEGPTDGGDRPAGGGGGGADLRKVHRLLRGRYHWAVLAGFGLAAVGGAAGVRLGRKTFQSTGVLQVMVVVPKIMYTVDEKGMLPGFDTYVDAQVTLITSQRVIDSALDQPVWAGRSPGKSDAALAAFTRGLDVSRKGDLIWVKSTDADPMVAVDSVSAVIAAYQKVYSELEAESGDKRRELREEYRGRLAAEWSSYRQQILAIAKVYGSDDLKSQYDFKLQELNKLEVSIGELKRALPEASQPGPATRPTGDLTDDEIAAVDARMANQLGERDRCERHLSELRLGSGEGNPQVKLAVAELAFAQHDVEAERASYNRRAAAAANGLGTGLGTGGAVAGLSEAVIRERLRSLTALYESNDQDVHRLGQQELDIEDLRGKAVAVKQQLDETAHAIEQMDLESQATGRVVVLSNADRPVGPYRDTRPTFAAAGGMGGLALGLGAVLGVGLLRRRLESPDDADADAPGLPLLGVIGQLPDDLSDPEQAAVASHAVHQVRTLLQITGQRSRHQVFAVTSSEAGTGKTSLTLALGVSFATARLRTLLIDCDMVAGGLTRRANVIVRRQIGRILQRNGLITDAQLHEALRLARGSRRQLGECLVDLGYLTDADLATAVSQQGEGRDHVGLIDALEGEPLAACLTETGIEFLSVLPLGRASAQHVGRLSPDALRRVIDLARRQFDVVLIDTGPVPGSLEAAVAASQCDAVVLTVSRGEHPGLLDRSVAHLAAVGAPVAGYVFNRARDRDVRRYGSSTLMSAADPSAADRHEMMTMTAESAGFGPVARAVASYVPVASSGASTRR